MLHAKHQAWLDFTEEASLEFEKRTGLKPLDDWFAFERVLNEIAAAKPKAWLARVAEDERS